MFMDESGQAGPVHTVATCFPQTTKYEPRMTPRMRQHGSNVQCACHTHTRALGTARQKRSKKSGCKALLRDSSAVLDVFRSGEEADHGGMFSAGTKTMKPVPPSPDHKNSLRRSPCTTGATA